MTIGSSLAEDHYRYFKESLQSTWLIIEPFPQHIELSDHSSEYAGCLVPNGFVDGRVQLYALLALPGIFTLLNSVTDAALPQYSGYYKNSSMTLPKTFAMMNGWLRVSVTVWQCDSMTGWQWLGWRESREWSRKWKVPGFWQLGRKSGITEWGGFGHLNS